jgi:hypothetical protein
MTHRLTGTKRRKVSREMARSGPYSFIISISINNHTPCSILVTLLALLRLYTSSTFTVHMYYYPLRMQLPYATHDPTAIPFQYLNPPRHLTPHNKTNIIEQSYPPFYIVTPLLTVISCVIRHFILVLSPGRTLVVFIGKHT